MGAKPGGTPAGDRGRARGDPSVCKVREDPRGDRVGVGGPRGVHCWDGGDLDGCRPQGEPQLGPKCGRGDLRSGQSWDKEGPQWVQSQRGHQEGQNWGGGTQRGSVLGWWGP